LHARRIELSARGHEQLSEEAASVRDGICQAWLPFVVGYKSSPGRTARIQATHAPIVLAASLQA